MTTIHRTLPDRAALHPSGGWIPFRGKWITALPLVDLDHHGLFARLTYRDSLEVAKRLGARMLTKAEFDEVWKFGHRLKPVLMTPGPRMASLVYATIHDARYVEQLEQTLFDGTKPAAMAKIWAFGAPEGVSFNYGLFREDGTPWQPLADEHNDQHTDYSQLAMFIRDTAPEEAAGGGWLASVRAVARELFEAITTDGAGVPRIALPHGYRCSVAELVHDAQELGTWVDVDEGLPDVGDLLVSGRLGEDPRKGGRGHVERASRWEAKQHPLFTSRRLWSLGGNEQNQWIEAPFEGVAYLGFIRVPSALGLKALELGRAEMAAGVREIAGPKHHKRIQAYHAGARRGGSYFAGMPGYENEGRRILGLLAADEIHWCASSQSFVTYEAAKLLAA